jgi:hypothetical protein
MLATVQREHAYQYCIEVCMQLFNYSMLANNQLLYGHHCSVSWPIVYCTVDATVQLQHAGQ